MQTFNINCEKFPLFRTLAIIHLNIKKKKKKQQPKRKHLDKVSGTK